MAKLNTAATASEVKAVRDSSLLVNPSDWDGSTIPEGAEGSAIAHGLFARLDLYQSILADADGREGVMDPDVLRSIQSDFNRIRDALDNRHDLTVRRTLPAFSGQTFGQAVQEVTGSRASKSNRKKFGQEVCKNFA